MRRPLLAYLAPLALLVAVAVVPLATGARTLVLRDVFNTHLALRATLADGLRSGRLPLIDPARAGGQPLAGNPNAVPFYPDNLLLLVASDLWQLNAHFWLHWLVALASAYWLGRAWGLQREGAIGVGAAYAFSGFFLSQLNLYNAVAPVALAPALAAAMLETEAPATRRRGLLLTGALLGLLLVGGDPILALLALGAALALALSRHGRKLPWPRVALALGCGVLLAMPQIVELARILPESYRGYWGYGAAAQSRTAADPRAVIDLVLPLFFGRPDRGLVWGTEYFGGFPPLYFSLAPGWIVLLLAAGGITRERRSLVALALVVAGLACAFSGGTPWGGWLAALPAGGVFRFPVKLALLAALGGSLLAGLGLERALAGGARRRLSAGLVAATVAGFGLWLLLSAAPARALAGFTGLFAQGLPLPALDAERTRWAGITLLATLFVAGALAAWRGFPRTAAGAALVALHAASQLVLLAPLVPTDDAAPYRRRPAIADRLPAGSRLAHGGVLDLFGPGWERVAPGDRATVRLLRRAREELQPFAGRPLGFAYELDIAPDGLDAFVTHAVARGMKGFSDGQRLGVLEALGVDRLLLYRDLARDTAERAVLEATVATAGSETRIYRLERTLPEVALLGAVRYAPTMNDALGRIFDPRFDPRAEALVAGSGEPRQAPAGSVTVRHDEPERIELETESEQAGVLVLRRAHLAIWRAEIDGVEVATQIAQLTRLAVEVPAGRHRVRFWIGRSPLAAAGAAALAGLLGLLLLASRSGRPGSRVLASRPPA